MERISFLCASLFASVVVKKPQTCANMAVTVFEMNAVVKPYQRTIAIFALVRKEINILVKSVFKGHVKTTSMNTNHGDSGRREKTLLLPKKKT